MPQTNTERPKVLYLFAGSRRAFYEKWKDRLVPDTQLLGLPYMQDFGVDAEFLEFQSAEFLRKVNFNLVHIPYLFSLRRYDIVFIGAGLPLVFLARKILRWKHPYFVMYNTSLVNALRRNKSGLSGFITRGAIKEIDVILSTSRAQAAALAAEGIDPVRIVCRPIGIDARFFANRAAGKPAENARPYILSVGRDLGRDYRTLFSAVENLPIELRVATKPEAVTGLSVPRNVKLLFHVPHEKMPALYRNALFALVPLRPASDPAGSDTSGQYGFLEPMASGKAVIVSNRETVRDYLTDKKDALLVPAGDAGALREAIELLLRDPKLRGEIARAGQEKVLRSFTSERFARALAQIFHALARGEVIPHAIPW